MIQRCNCDGCCESLSDFLRACSRGYFDDAWTDSVDSDAMFAYLMSSDRVMSTTADLEIQYAANVI